MTGPVRVSRVAAAAGWIGLLAAVLAHAALAVLAVTEFVALGWPLPTWFDTGAVALVLATGVVGLVASVRLAIKSALGARALRALIRSDARPVPAIVRTEAAALDCATMIDVVAETEPFAVTYGLIHPRILVSTGLAAALLPAEIRAVLAHEREHLRHRDPLRFLAGRLLAAWACYLPAASWLAGRTALRRELAADRAAAERASRGVLAGALLKLAGPPASPAFAAASPAGGRSGSLEARVAQLEAGRPPRQRPAVTRLLASAGTLSLLMPASLCCAAMAQFVRGGLR